jgi:CubicO group peptidase (beta-lactamase class C family)
MSGKLTDDRMEAAIDRAVQLGENGLKVAVWLGDELIIDTWRGAADIATGKPVDERTIFPVFSVSKAVASSCVHLLAERGIVDYAAPVAEYWPEFGQNGKEGVTVRHVLTHRAGLPQMPEGVTPEDFADWDLMCERIAALPLLWAPGSRNSYLAYTFGYMLGMIVERADPGKRRFAEFFHDELKVPLGIESFWIGLPKSERDRVGVLTAEAGQRVGSERAPYNHLALPPAIVPSPAVFNREDVQSGCIPAANGIADAKSAARLFSLLANRGTANGKRLLSEERVMSFTRLRDDPLQPDEVIGRPPLVGLGGYFVGGEYPPAEPAIGSNPHVLAQPGGGQTIAWADLDSHFSAAITHNRMFGNIPPRPLEDHPFSAIADAVRATVADRLA